METLGRDCVYVIIGISVLFFLSLVTQSFNVLALIVGLPLIALTLWVVSSELSKENTQRLAEKEGKHG
ncbi:hypothetical protein CEY16_13305 [Halalkalibacillus sediminis]|uniref:Uncharacterized protein n=1 Tax=Halalkalibacillus sediminis TaxID=2018042 RepID=A0A2I0QR33_9BACI|nr:hypothetical protein [Halalkalibacillus sediminis]PKR76791.1 hypothetical protein CEY16_13305 [Halalkalibacillus sediminis]